MKKNLEGLIFHISRASGEDGPGIRTTVFFKGCPMRCSWCHSPQSQGGLEPILSHYPSRCINCGACSGACPEGVHGIVRGQRRISWDDCNTCGICAEQCPSRALEMVGRWMTVDEVVDVVSRDKGYYSTSRGGVTFSGGEPTMQPDFVYACAKTCGELGIHTALDTCGYVKWHFFEKLLPAIDLVLFDIKQVVSYLHTVHTGVTNTLVLENLKRVDAYGRPIWLRIPLIPGYNDSRKNIDGIVALAKGLRHIQRITILPYNTAAGAKYPSIGRTFSLHVQELSEEAERRIMESLASTGVRVELRQ